MRESTEDCHLGHRFIRETRPRYCVVPRWDNKAQLRYHRLKQSTSSPWPRTRDEYRTYNNSIVLSRFLSRQLQPAVEVLRGLPSSSSPPLEFVKRNLRSFLCFIFSFADYIRRVSLSLSLTLSSRMHLHFTFPYSFSISVTYMSYLWQAVQWYHVIIRYAINETSICHSAVFYTYVKLIQF